MAQEAYTKCKNSEYSRLNNELISIESEPLYNRFLSSYKQRLVNLKNEIENSNFYNLTSFKKRLNSAGKNDSFDWNELSANITTVMKNTQSTIYDMKVEIADLNEKIDRLQGLVRSLIVEVKKNNEKFDSIGLTKSTKVMTSSTERSFIMDDDDEDMDDELFG